ncbi:hypothetical protein GJ496_005774 [Pomphorhynchus laevis]|nr:hypothetical protein GJ496_005774 [Pomphorhynchus laevis]
MRRPFIDAKWPVTKGRGPHTLWRYKYLRGIYKRQQLCKPLAEDHPSKFIWNYNSELFACNNRLGECQISKELSKKAFTDISYSQSQLRKHLLDLDHNLDNTDSAIISAPKYDNNVFLSQHGKAILTNYVEKVHKVHYPRLSKYCRDKVVEYYASAKFNAELAEALGFKDLIRSEFPMTNKVDIMSTAMYAYVGAIETSSGVEKAEKFIKDMYFHSYVDINELFDLDDPFQYLQTISEKTLEPRLLWSTGCSTMLPCYVVGIYSKEDKQLLGQSPGQTIEEATTMACRDGLRNIFEASESRAPIS